MEPHHPYWEQQFPKVEPLQVYLVVPPQVPSVETLRVEVAAAAELALVEVAAFTDELAALTEDVPLFVQVPKLLWQPVPQ